MSTSGSDVRINWNGRNISASLQAAALRALKDAAEHVLTESNKIAPLDEGDLTRSGNVDSGLESGTPTAVVYYDTPYAAKVHEHPEYNFQNGREGKYLEKTLENEREAILRYLADECRRALGG